jgi:hypothetical protein
MMVGLPGSIRGSNHGIFNPESVEKIIYERIEKTSKYPLKDDVVH